MLIYQTRHLVEAKMNEIISNQSPIDSKNTAISETSFIRRSAALLRTSRMVTDWPANARLVADFNAVLTEMMV